MWGFLALQNQLYIHHCDLLTNAMSSDYCTKSHDIQHLEIALEFDTLIELGVC